MMYAILFIILVYFFFKNLYGWCYSKVCLVGKTAVITGGNSGIGYQAALSLASRGCRVIIADKDDSSITRDVIIKETNNPNILSMRVDLQSFHSVRNFAKNVIESEPELHILINNAGIGTSGLHYTEDGLQKTMQVNYYSHFLLTHLLLDLLKKSSPSRIIFTSSSAAFLTKLNLEDMNPWKPQSLLRHVYSNSKLCEIIAANEFAERLKGSGVTANSFHPGGVRSKIFMKAFMEEKAVTAFLAGIFALIFGKLTLSQVWNRKHFFDVHYKMSTEQGAQTMIYLACAKEVENVSGQFFVDCFRFIQPWQTYNKQFCKKVWDASMKLTGLESTKTS